MADALRTVPLFGIPVNPFTMDEVVDLCGRTIRARSRLLIGVVNAAKVVNMRRDAELRQAVLESDVILADGMAIVWASRLLRRSLPERVAGIDLFVRLLERADACGHRVYCLGAREDVLETVVRHIEKEYPGAVVAGRHHGYFTADQEAGIVDEIAAARPDLLFVAMSPPKKEQFLARWDARLQVPVCHGVGGSFDVIAGKVKRAPRLWQKLGMEWLYRVLQEPWRLWRRYLVTNTLFCGMVVRELASRGSAGPASDATP